MINPFKDKLVLDKIFRIAIESSRNHTVITDVNGIICFANAAAQQATGYSFEEMKGKTPRLWGGQMQVGFFKNLWRVISEERKPFKGEIINRRKDGMLYTSTSTISPIIDENGRLMGFLGIEEDVTAIKEYQSTLVEKTAILDKTLSHLKEQNAILDNSRKAILNILEDEKVLQEELKKEKEGVEQKVKDRTKELADEKARLMAAIGSLPQGFLIVNTSNEIVVYNNRLASILEKNEEAWTLEKVNMYLGDTIDLKSDVTQAISNKKIIKHTEVKMGLKYLKLFIAPIMSGITTGESGVIGSIITISDITEERLLARSKDEFFSIASHELRTPLTAIRGNTSMILDYYGKELVNPDLKTMITDTHDASIRLIAIVNDFLDVSRLEQQKIEFKKEPFDIILLIHKILNEYQPTLINSKTSLIFNEPDTSIPPVLADSEKVRQVIINLMGNALKFTEEGQVKISLSLQKSEILFTISDSGRGINPDYQALLFRKFQQAGNSLITRDTTRGTGLGLYISHLMVTAMGGKIWLVQSEEGKGSTFAFTLPLSS